MHRVGNWFSLQHVLPLSAFRPGRLKNVHIEGWAETLKEMRQFWLERETTTLETSWWQNADGSLKRVL